MKCNVAWFHISCSNVMKCNVASLPAFLMGIPPHISAGSVLSAVQFAMRGRISRGGSYFPPSHIQPFLHHFILLQIKLFLKFAFLFLLALPSEELSVIVDFFIHRKAIKKCLPINIKTWKKYIRFWHSMLKIWKTISCISLQLNIVSSCMWESICERNSSQSPYLVWEAT